MLPLSNVSLIILNENRKIQWKSEMVEFSQPSCSVFYFDNDRLVTLDDKTQELFDEKLKHCISKSTSTSMYLDTSNTLTLIRFVPVREITSEYVKVMALVYVDHKKNDVESSLGREYFMSRWSFSFKEARVAEKLVSELSFHEIASTLNLSLDTVRWYQKVFCERFSVSGRVGFLVHVFRDAL